MQDRSSIKSPKKSATQVLDSQTKESKGSELYSERCNIYLRRGFTVVAISVNDSNGRLCVLRKSDSSLSASKNEPGSPSKVGTNIEEKQLFLVEFYNFTHPPIVYMECSIPVIHTSLESVIWMGSAWAIIGCADGALLMLSPFTTDGKRTQICASPILGIVRLSPTQLVVANDSSELVVVDFKEVEPEEGEDLSARVSLSARRSIKISSEERIISLAACTSLKTPLLAVGMINHIQIIEMSTGINDRRVNIAIPRDPNMATIIWSLVFVGETLFAGDSQGKVTIYNAKNGAIIKIFKTHQAPVLALATDGHSVFASGSDYRIQVITGISNERQINWLQSGQRLLHQNDVRALCCNGQWLISGGAEHDFVISDRDFTVAYPILRRECAFSLKSGLILMRHPLFVELWYKPDNINLPANLLQTNSSASNIIHVKRGVEFGPRKLAVITSGSPAEPITHASISPNGNFVCLADITGTVRVLLLAKRIVQQLVTEACGGPIKASSIENYWNNWEIMKNSVDDDQEPERKRRRKTNENLPMVTSIACSNEWLYYSTEQFNLMRLNFDSKELQVISHRRNGASIIKIAISPLDKALIALTSNSQILYFTMKERLAAVENGFHGDEEEGPMEVDYECESIELRYPVIDCVFASETKLVFLCANLNAQLVFFDLTKRECTFVLNKRDLRLHYNQFLVYMSDVADNELIVTANVGHIRIVSGLDKDKPTMYMKKGIRQNKGTGEDLQKTTQEIMSENEDDEDDQQQQEKPVESVVKPKLEHKRNDVRVEPFWGSELAETTKRRLSSCFNEAGGLPLCKSPLLIGQSAFEPPSRVPVKLKRFGMN